MSLKTEFRMGITDRVLAFGQDCKALEPSDGIDPLFLAYAIKSRTPMILGLVDEAGHGTGRLNTSQLFDVMICLPPPSEQIEIAEVLGALDDKIAANRKLATTADSLAEAVFIKSVNGLSKAARGGDCEGQELTIRELARRGCLTFGDGYRTKRSELDEDGFRIVRVADISDGQVSLSGSDFVTYDRRSAIGVKAGQSGDILLTTKGTVGRLAVFEGASEDVVYSPQVCFFRVHDNDTIDRTYLRRWFASADFVRQASYRKGNTDMADYINLADIGSLTLMLPDIAEQRSIGEVLGPLDRLVSSLRAESRTLAAIRDALLPQLMSGKLRVRDAERQVEAVL
ncbi:type I restriction enzyme S subunit [Rhodococcus sp. PvR099]|nr:type I restriction enzyme S subunit [Rhodococcus sp. PvR099]